MKELLLLAHLWTAADGTVHDARWIEENFRECCGEEDCAPVQPGQARFTPAGWKIEGFGDIVPMKAVLPSMDGKPWVCRYLWQDGYPPEKRRIRCLFLPRPKG